MSLHVLIADDHTLVSEGLEVMLSMAEDVELAGSVSNGQAAIDAAHEGDVDVILMDVKLSHSMSGIEATRQVKKIDPSTRVLIMSLLTDPETVSEAIKAGADGYLSKSASREAVIQAIHDVAEGRSVLDPSVTGGFFGRIGGKDPDALTDRELKCLQCLADGLSTKEIAREMHIAEETVKTYLRSMYRKLGVRHSGLFSSLIGVDSRSKQDPAELTDREKKVREGMMDGLSTQEIAARLDLPEETVKTNQRSLRQKLGSRYWTEVNPKSILKEFWHRIRKDK
jgi:two-component system, NarL family, response regulator LiaR